MLMKCPVCASEDVVKNGKIHTGKQRFKCHTCGRQFVTNPTKKMITPATKALIEKLLLERISLAGICRVTGVSESWLQRYVNTLYAEVPKQIEVQDKPKGRLTLEWDELWSFVGHKGNKQWLWLAKDVASKEMVGVALGSRDREGAQGLWVSLPGVYRQCAVCYPDFWSAYAEVLPSKRHRPVNKASGKTSHLERFNNTLRQRVSRLVRKTLSFSKKLANHLGAIWYFIHQYNASLACC
jgi:insertion element IS1 protein InsB